MKKQRPILDHDIAVWFLSAFSGVTLAVDTMLGLVWLVPQDATELKLITVLTAFVVGIIISALAWFLLACLYDGTRRT